MQRLTYINDFYQFLWKEGIPSYATNNRLNQLLNIHLHDSWLYNAD